MGVTPFVVAPRERRLRPITPMLPAKPWRPTRPGDIEALQPQGGHLGYQGPDQGYALLLSHLFEHQVVLARWEKWSDVAYGIAGVANRRASLAGRAPVHHDLEVGFIVWGFLTFELPAKLIEELTRLR